MEVVLDMVEVQVVALEVEAELVEVLVVVQVVALEVEKVVA